MASLVFDNRAVPRSHDTLGGAGTSREPSPGTSCLGVALGPAAVAWASLAAVALLLV